MFSDLDLDKKPCCWTIDRVVLAHVFASVVDLCSYFASLSFSGHSDGEDVGLKRIAYPWFLCNSSIKDLELLLLAPGHGKSLGKPLSSLRLPWLHQRFPARGSSNGWSNIMSDGLIFLNNVCPRVYSSF
ncbi:hypothetical protein Bca4012_074028 [Brassica carinata]